jgi:class 3 adenylate cyclase
MSKLSLDEVEVVGDRVQVAARLVDLAQRERVFAWRTHGMPEEC